MAISVPDEGTEKLVASIELKRRGHSDEDAMDKIVAVKRGVNSAISDPHGFAVADLVVVAPGSIPITTSGRLDVGVRRAVPARAVRPRGRLAVPASSGCQRSATPSSGLA